MAEVQMYDGLGGKTGKTDEECLSRNGEIVTIDEFRDANRAEHPNGTLGAVPVTVGVDLQPIEPGLVHTNAAQSGSIYGVSAEGLILSEDEVGRALTAA